MTASTLPGYDLPKILEQYKSEGYVILDHVVPESSLDELRKASEQVVELTRSGGWPHRRVVGKAFPPFDKENRDSWGVQHLMNPRLPNARLFSEFYSSSPLLEIASALLEAPMERMQMELFNLLINPSDHYFALAWHRDDVKPELDEEEERKRLATPTFGVQFNTALYDDDCLFVVPGTHSRVRDGAEREANMAKAPPAVTRQEVEESKGEGKPSAAFDGNWQVDPPTTLRVSLKAGQTVFYSQRILHRASYLPTKVRATLHGCYGDSGEPGDGNNLSGGERARNILQHGVEWMREDDFGASLPERLKPMWENLIRMDKEWSSKNLGYSLDG
ncbi:hypothetical protein IE53DRAFT_388693 [Violaceomyces palustris]|uniref:Uncharacterized protein n=1 Tax=Violaceomyces palustris TaxID=1673888 RepID=A0ACD0NTI9_9BASI|nr:hypothetical protein IE53DRAFT_388693 [Violaceomyces palustris]